MNQFHQSSFASESDEDKRLYVQFYMDAVEDVEASRAAGRPMFKDTEMVKIIVPGSRDSFMTPVDDRIRQRFPSRYAAFKAQQTEQVEGTPLETVPFLTKAQVQTLRGANCLTLEQLAGMSDEAAQTLMGFYGLREKARTLLAAATESAPLLQLQEQLAEKDGKIAVLENQVKELAAKLNKLLEEA